LVVITGETSCQERNYNPRAGDDRSKGVENTSFHKSSLIFQVAALNHDLLPAQK